MEPATLYELALEPERQPVVTEDKQTIRGERVNREKLPHEVEKLYRYLGMLPK